MAYKPVKSIEVRCWGQPVGVIAHDPASDAYAFEYFNSFGKTGWELAPLTIPRNTTMPVAFPNLPRATFYGLPAFIADSLPDTFGNALIDSWMAQHGVRKDAITALDRLAYMGKRGMGALEFRPALRSEGAKPTALEMAELVNTARKALMVNIDAKDSMAAVRLSTQPTASNTTTAPDAQDEDELAQLISVGTSAGGARAKAVVGFNPHTGAFVSGQFNLPAGYEHWLMKFDIEPADKPGASRSYGRIEYAYHLMVRACGVQMEDCALFEAAGRAHFMTRRFDRAEGNRKLHLQTLCALAELDFNQRGAHDYSQLFMAVEDLGLGYEAIDQVFLRMVFNVCMANNDDHTKNHSFVLAQGGAWQLAPAYDVTHAYNKHSLWTSKHLMSVNGQFSNITRANLLAVAQRFNVRAPKDCIGQVLEIAAHWEDYAREAGVTQPEAARVRQDIAACAALL